MVPYNINKNKEKTAYLLDVSYIHVLVIYAYMNHNFCFDFIIGLYYLNRSEKIGSDRLTMVSVKGNRRKKRTAPKGGKGFELV